MNNSINNESFYINLLSIIKAKIQEVYKTKRIYKLSVIFSIILYTIQGFVFIYLLRDILFIHNYFFDLNQLFNLCKILIVISGAIFITSYINKIPKDNYTKSLISLKELLTIDVCTCNTKCNCKNSILSYLKKQGINLPY